MQQSIPVRGSSAAGTRRRTRRTVGFLSLTALALFAACDAGSTAPDLDGGSGALRLSRTSVELLSGDTTRLTATLVGSEGPAPTGPSITWSSSDPSVVDVSRSGLILAKRSGEVLVTAASGRLQVKSNVKVTGHRKQVIVSPKVDSVSVGGSRQLSATVLDPKGQIDPNAPLKWASLNSDVARVSSTGTVTAVAAGVALITATSRGMVDTARVHVLGQAPSAPVVASIRLTPTTASLDVGQDVKLVAQALDAKGNVLGDAAITWTSSDASVARVSEAGVVTGAAEGTATITAQSDAAKAAAQVTVKAARSTPPPSSNGPAELPRVYVDTRMPQMNGNVIRVRAGDNLQAAIDRASRGDVIELEAGAEFRGAFTLPAKPGSGWVVIRSAGFSVPEGTRVRPADAARMAKIVGTSADRRPLTVDGSASHYRVIGLELTYAPSFTRANAIVDVRPGSSHIVIDRSYVHGHDGLDVQRCVVLHAEHGAVIDSHLSQCHYSGQDSQAIIAWNTNGPLKIANNHLEGAGENIMFGGAMPAQGVIPSDIEIRGNYFYKPVQWKDVWTVKNLFEIKSAQRVLLEGNVFENNWKGGQDGMAFNIKVSDQSGRAPWNVAQDITFRNNWVKNVDGGMKLSGVKRVTIENNVFENLKAFGSNGRLFQIQNRNEDIHLLRNTGFGTYSAITASSETRGFVMTDNIATRGGYGIKGDGGEGTATLETNFPGHVFSGNVLIGANASRYPTSGNHYPATVEEVRFQNYGAGDYRLSSGSPVRGKGTRGQDPGADIGLLREMVARVVR